MIQVGEVLDKYELLERVGQGGMAVVYRGLDRSLKRVVAVKILHKHLSDYQEARDRFEREAQAVAKLRHENILEIFDYSGADEAKAAGSSYIVTEFIDGQTLKQIITDRPIQFPEIGAMIMLQVGRALAHAHAAGILHRDVKPENIMVRNDGIVKLMDFGISHMLDLERLTVTGQLLGSPAYMAPEHVEGRQLDFRTDVFAAGIVLYQLTVGRLPFEGKNPHEVLKRIAECKFTDPRQVNPQIGNRLGRIILKAMAAEPKDRFPNVGEMVRVLEGYLEESGIAADKIAGELARYFQSPVAYEQAFETRLVDHLTTRGQKLLGADDRSAALDVFDRVLTIDPDNEKVLAILDGINRRRRLRQTALAAGAVCLLAVCAYGVHRNSRPIEPELPNPTFTSQSPPTIYHAWLAQPDDLAEPHPMADAAVAIADVKAPGSDDAFVVTTRDLTVTVSPSRGTEVNFGDGVWRAVDASGSVTHAITGDVKVQARNASCCVDSDVKPIAFADAAPVHFDLALNNGYVVAKCERAGDLDIKIDGRSVKRGEARPIFFGVTTVDNKNVTVVFVKQDGSEETKKVRVVSGQTVPVACDAP